MKIDRMFFEKFEDKVKDDPTLKEQVEAEHWDQAVEYVHTHLFDKPEEFFNLEKLSRAAGVDRRITVREILEKIFGFIPGFKAKDQLLEDEFQKFNGRAAVIVPEGIIFQSGGAYKQLRETLVKNYLLAVISLPAGVFNPYSGVKTSVLVLDKRLSKKTDAILFAKIHNDGYNLGAQRRPIDKNDLPATARNIKAWLESLRNGTAFDVEHILNMSLVAKEKIGENGEWNLSGERYQSQDDLIHREWPHLELGKVCKKITDGSHFSPETQESGYPYVTVKDLSNGFIDLTNAKKIGQDSYRELVKNGCQPKVNDVLFSKDGTVG